MTVVLHLDREQADLIDAALSFAVAALDTRAKRVDPGGVVSEAHRLQEIKLQQVRMQMAAPPLATYSSLSKANRSRIDRAFEAWPTLQSDLERDGLLTHIQGLCDECRFDAKTD